MRRVLPDSETAAESVAGADQTGPFADATRRGFLACMAWAGAGVAWSIAGGVLSSCSLPGLGTPRDRATRAAGDLLFVQISDTHVGFSKPPNPDPVATLQESIARIRALDPAPALLIHTGDLSHAQKPGAFDTVDQLLREARVRDVAIVPGEHDVFDDGGKEFFSRFGAGLAPGGWRSFDVGGVHFVGLVNVLEYKSAGLGRLGDAQLAWLERDLAARSPSTPIVVYAHVPLWSVYPAWGWVTEDGERALGMLRRFGSATVLNGHIHQVMQKVEGSVTFHTARSTAYPQPAPGSAPGPGPLQVPMDRVRQFLGLREVRYREGDGALAIVDSTLG